MSPRPKRIITTPEEQPDDAMLVAFGKISDDLKKGARELTPSQARYAVDAIDVIWPETPPSDAPSADDVSDGPVDGDFPQRRLHAFLCLLLQEGLTVGVIEQFMQRAEMGVVDLVSPHITAYAADLEQRLLPQEEQDHTAAAQFWKRIYDAYNENGWGEMDSETYVEHAEACGLMASVPYNPTKHGEIEGGDVEEGDAIHFPTALARRLFARAAEAD